MKTRTVSIAVIVSASLFLAAALLYPLFVQVIYTTASGLPMKESAACYHCGTQQPPLDLRETPDGKFFHCCRKCCPTQSSSQTTP